MVNNKDYLMAEDKQLMNAYDSINKITNYQKVGCKEMKDSKNSDYYEKLIERLDNKYNNIIGNYGTQFTNYKMYLAKQDFFSGDDGTDAVFDKGLASSIFSKDVKVKSPPKSLTKTTPGLISKEEAKEELFERSDNIYKDSLKYGEQWADQNWYVGNPYSETTSLNEVNNFRGPVGKYTATVIRIENKLGK